MTRLKILPTLAIVLSALILAACQTTKSSARNGEDTQPYYGWDGARGGGGP